MRLLRLIAAIGFLGLPTAGFAQELAGTKPLTGKDDFARVMVDGIHHYLDKLTQDHIPKRTASWKPDYSSKEAYAKSLEPQRTRLRKMLGMVDVVANPQMEYISSTERPAVFGENKDYRVKFVRWRALMRGELFGEGLLLEPTGKVKASVVAIPDAGQTPEEFVGLELHGPKAVPFINVMASNGIRVIVPRLIDREAEVGRKQVSYTNQSHREFVYRMSFEMGRHVIGYELEKVLAAVNWLSGNSANPSKNLPIGVIGYGEGGLLALYSAAIDNRIAATLVSGYFGPRESLWQEPIDRNVWGLLREFGDAEIARLIVPRTLIVEPSSFNPGPLPKAEEGRRGGAPGILKVPSLKEVQREFDRIVQLDPEGRPLANFKLCTKGFPEPLDSKTPPMRDEATAEFLSALNKGKGPELAKPEPLTRDAKANLNPIYHQRIQFDEAVSFTQSLMGDLMGPAVKKRQDFFWSKLDTSSIDKFKKSQEPLRDYFWDNIIGKLPAPTMPMNPRTRLILEEPKWKGYEVVLDLYDEVICFGILLVPNDIKPGEKRPVVVCQHGLEGRPMDVVNPKVKTNYYNSFGADLANRGFVVFAPQNPYIFQNEFRQFCRKANPMGLHIYSFIVRQHERILEFLGTLPFVDATHIAYYGLSYGGKVAMRIPALLNGYCLSICSGDFNEWIWKNINLDWVGSYMFTGEYEMYEFDLGNTFNYAEMAALIAPRPFMVERGHSDRVGLDEYVAFEYAKVRRLYASLGIADRTEIEFFTGGHVIHGQGTFAFLHHHLNWPKK